MKEELPSILHALEALRSSVAEKANPTPNSKGDDT
jgi:hypothetical protein